MQCGGVNSPCFRVSPRREEYCAPTESARAFTPSSSSWRPPSWAWAPRPRPPGAPWATPKPRSFWPSWPWASPPSSPSAPSPPSARPACTSWAPPSCPSATQQRRGGVSQKRAANGRAPKTNLSQQREAHGLRGDGVGGRAHVALLRLGGLRQVHERLRVLNRAENIHVARPVLVPHAGSADAAPQRLVRERAVRLRHHPLLVELRAEQAKRDRQTRFSAAFASRRTFAWLSSIISWRTKRTTFVMLPKGRDGARV